MSDTSRHLALVGLMGAGKTEVGHRCAERLERELIDTDDLVERAAGMTINEIFSSAGEEGFRAREGQAVADACAAPVPSVIACGGGAPLDAGNRERLRNAAFVVWLTATPQTLAERVGRSDARPLLRGVDPLASLERMAVLREAAYRETADAVVDTDDRSIEAVADAVVEAFTAAEARA